MFSKILIANRGEIAVRIIRACKEMGIATVAVFSEADADSLAVALADESFCIGKSEVAESYLQKERIISAALVAEAQAIHPGYGFLAENADFARLCQENDLVFIGPSIETMQALENKAEVKKFMVEAGLEVIPGSPILASVAEAQKAAEAIGYPVLLKACLGGGGRGIRLVEQESELAGAFEMARAEAIAAFGDGSLYLEKYVYPARHIEVQILADEAGQVIGLGERDCSIQRKKQKLIEESPSPGVTPKQRQDLMAKAVKAVQGLNYWGAGTLEFLLAPDGRLYFMEMNIRLQVEHPVTEFLTGIDLVKWQIRIAAGMNLDFKQEDLDFEGSALECRINALAPGKVEFLHVAGGPFVRFDTYLMTGSRVSPYYDPLVGKLIIYAASREEALRKMKAALCELVIDGVPNNIEEQIEIIGSQDFMSGDYNLSFFEK